MIASLAAQFSSPLLDVLGPLFGTWTSKAGIALVLEKSNFHRGRVLIGARKLLLRCSVSRQFGRLLQVDTMASDQ